LQAQASSEKQAVQAFLNSSAGAKLLSDSKSGQVLQLSSADVDRLYREGGAGSQTLRVLQQLASSGQQFDSVQALIDGVQAAQSRQAVQDFLNSRSNQLFSNAPQPVVLSAAEVDKLIAACGGSVAETLRVLADLNARGVKVNNFAELMAAVAKARSQAEADKQAAVAFASAQSGLL